jgi:hypothetical protein
MVEFSPVAGHGGKISLMENQPLGRLVFQYFRPL